MYIIFEEIFEGKEGVHLIRLPDAKYTNLSLFLPYDLKYVIHWSVLIYLGRNLLEVDKKSRPRVMYYLCFTRFLLFMCQLSTFYKISIILYLMHCSLSSRDSSKRSAPRPPLYIVDCGCWDVKFLMWDSERERAVREGGREI